MNLKVSGLKTVTDQMQREVSFIFPPQRIISLVPSQTELLYDLGLKSEVVGQTLFCIHPDEMFRIKPRVGGTKKVKHNQVSLLQPDLIIANKEENTREDIELLMQQYPVWISDIETLEDAMEMIRSIGYITNRDVAAEKIANEIIAGFTKLPLPSVHIRSLYLIWREPWMAAGTSTFINDMLKRNGLMNVAGERYPELSNDNIRSLSPELILLSSEPYPFKEKHIAELRELCPSARILLVDGEMFSWYGSRLRYAAKYFEALLQQIHT